MEKYVNEEFEKLKKQVFSTHSKDSFILELDKNPCALSGLSNKELEDIVNAYIAQLGYKPIRFDLEWFKLHKGIFENFTMQNEIITFGKAIALKNYKQRIKDMREKMKTDIRWRMIDILEAKKNMKSILARTLAYRSRIIDDATVEMLCNKYFDCFDSPVCFTNGEFELEEENYWLKIWTPITNNTFDVGIVLLDNHNIGIAWAMDED